MRKLVGLLGVFLLISSCSTINEWRRPASFGRDLSGTYLGVADYKVGRKGPNKAATRIYMHEIDGERGSYNVLIHEYVNLVDMFPEFAVADKAPKLSNVIGFLKEITRKLLLYKAVPTDVDGTLALYPLTVAGNSIEPDMDAIPRKLVLKKDGELAHPLAGAKITGPDNDKKFQEIFFPTKDDKKYNGIQYWIANTLYNKIDFDGKYIQSTWRESFLPGPYLSAYKKLDDEVLTLSVEGNKNYANFVINPKYNKRSKRRRERMFTNKRSAYLSGKFELFAPRPGMFLASPVEADGKTISELNGKIGLFIDIFDATEARNQDVVELAFVDPSNPEDFLMYYEHPDNPLDRQAQPEDQR